MAQVLWFLGNELGISALVLSSLFGNHLVLHNTYYITPLIETLARTVRHQPYPGPRVCLDLVQFSKISGVKTADFFSTQVLLLIIHI
ncbi:hypothetical protein F5Y04DRAFT_248920 [Hypomontagnella monticulosa]|nr:hypothetical protein F5Y04DRAFT_248920 [Hypomontagnella monticulosa]